MCILILKLHMHVFMNYHCEYTEKRQRGVVGELLHTYLNKLIGCRLKLRKNQLINYAN